MAASGWIGIDLDGTLATYGGWKGADHIGAPVPAMVARVKQWLAEGTEVRIFTARIFPISFARADDDYSLLIGANDAESAAAAAIPPIQAWCRQHLGEVLPITCRKDFAMVELWDDRAVSVEMNTGRVLTEGR